MDDGWDLVIDSIEFRSTYDDETIKKILNNTLAPESKTDFADDGCNYTFDTSKFDNYVLDNPAMVTSFREVYAFNMVVAADMPEDPNRGREAEVNVEFDTTNMNDEQKDALFEMGNLLSKVGVGFDSGSGIDDDGMATRDWQWDWSLSGPMKVTFVRFVDDNPENRYDREHSDPAPDEASEMEEQIIKDADKAAQEAKVHADVLEFDNIGDSKIELLEVGDCIYVDLHENDEGKESWHYTRRQMDEAADKYTELCEKAQNQN